MTDQLSAEIEVRFSAGPLNAGAIVRVRDLIVCVGDPTIDVPIEEVYAHPPIGWGRHPGDAERFAEIVDMIDLGGGVVIEDLGRDAAELVMNACTPRGHYFVPVRQFGQRYSFIKEVALDELEHRHFAWDTDGTLDDALALSRLVRDNAYSTQYAARLLDYEDGQHCIAYVLHREDKSIYRLRRDREWLDAAEGRELAGLLAAYWECREELPPRVRRAMWRMAYAPRIRWADMVVPILIGGLEALLKIGRHGLTQQFKKRAPALAADVGIDGFGEDLAERLYDGRSDWVHGSHVQLFAGPSPSAEAPGEEEPEEEAPEGPQSSDEQSAFAEVALLQDVLRAAVRRAIEDVEFRQVFVADERIAERWPT